MRPFVHYSQRVNVEDIRFKVSVATVAWGVVGWWFEGASSDGPFRGPKSSGVGGVKHES